MNLFIVMLETVTITRNTKLLTRFLPHFRKILAYVLPYCYVLRQLNPVYPIAFTKGEKMQINTEVFNIPVNDF